MGQVALGLLACATLFAAIFLRESPSARTGFPLDDAWIHLVYGRNLLAGHGLAYNPGQLETGLTSPLWTLLISPLLALARSQTVLAIKALGLALHVLTAWLAAGTLLAVDVRRSIAVVTALAIALEPWSMFAALSGMEVPLTSCLLVCLIFAMATERTTLALGTMTLLPLARPESLLVVCAIWIVLLRARWSTSPARLRAALLVVPWLGWIAWSLHCKSVTGYALPSTFYAKASPSPAVWSHNIVALGSMLKATGLLVLVGTILGASIPTKGRRTSDSRRVHRFVGISVLAFVVAVLFGQPLREANTFYWLRYLLPALPLLLLIPAIVVSDWPRWPGQSRLVRILVLLVPMVLLLRWPLLTPRALAHYAGSCRNIDEMNLEVALWLRDHTARDEWIATNDAGAIAYFSERRVLDLVGLNNHRVVHGGLAGELQRTSPRYFAVFPSWFPAVERDRRFTRVYSARADHYVISSAAQDELVVYRFDR